MQQVLGPSLRGNQIPAGARGRGPDPARGQGRGSAARGRGAHVSGEERGPDLKCVLRVR